jgi:predicted ArsR family transcriptional regulator
VSVGAIRVVISKYLRISNLKNDLLRNKKGDNIMASLEKDISLSTREKILQYLLLNRSNKSDCCTVKDIALALSLSTNAARQYLVILEKEGLVVRTEKKGITGRPAMLYSLHEDALDTFPKQYVDFGVKLIEEVKEQFGEQETLKMLKKVGEKIADEVMPMLRENIEKSGGSLDSVEDRLKSIVKIYHEYGKYPELIEDENSFGLKNYNCLVFGIAKEDPLVCKVDETIVSELAGKRATKERCIRDGDDCCLYRIRKD